MSDLYRSALQARISNLPPLPPHPDPDPDDDDDEEARSSLGPMGPPFPPRYTKPAVPKAPNPAFSPLSAAPYFASASQVAVPPRHLDFRVYYTPPVSSGAVLVCHHGAGFSALSFACLAKEVQDMTAGKLGVLAVDARRHGKTVPMDGASDEDLSISVLTDDLTELLKTVFPDAKAAPELLLVGHSMGGAVVVHACPQLIDAGYSVLGVVVLDVVEGTALEALPYMNQILNARPDGFDSIEEAVEWHIKANQIHNPTSARISVPAIIVPTIIVPTTSSQSNTSASPSTPTSSSLSASSPLNSSSSSPSLSNASSSPSSPKKYTWRTALRSTGPYWETWFTSLSPLFLATRAARLLILAGTDRLDKPLMIGQMQGKFQLAVVGGGVGHCVHEDAPTRVAELVVEFWRRNERVVIRGKVARRVGEV